jgi:hypothetical protein
VLRWTTLNYLSGGAEHCSCRCGLGAVITIDHIGCDDEVRALLGILEDASIWA